MKEPKQGIDSERYNKRKLVYVIIGTSLGVYFGIQYILPLVVPFVFAYFLAKAVHPIVIFLYKRVRLPKMLGAALTLISVLGIIGIAVFYLLKTLLMQIRMLLQNIPIYQQLIASNLDTMCCRCDGLFGLKDGNTHAFIDSNMDSVVEKVRIEIMPAITEQTLQMVIRILGLIGILFIMSIATLMIIRDMPQLKEKYENGVFYQQIHPVAHTLSNLGFAYLRAQMIIISIIAVIITVGLFLMGNPYALLIGMGIALFDAFPILGSGSILIPWSIVQLIQGNLYASATMMTLYLCCQLVRQLLEPKLIGDKIGIKPIFTIMAMYIGLRLFGIVGVFLGPVGLVTIITIVKQTQSELKF